MPLDIQPKLTTIESGYLEQLMASKYNLDNITKGCINQHHLQLVCDSMLKAKRKHPDFADTMTDWTLKDCRFTLNAIRNENDIRENYGSEIAEDILTEELLEAVEKYLIGDMNGFKAEIADAIAVLLRIMEMADRENKG